APPVSPARVPGFRGVVALAGLGLVTLAATMPGVAVAMLVALLAGLRLAGIVVEEVRARRARRGPRPSDTAVTTLLTPWCLVRAAAVAVCAGVIVVLLGLAVFGPGNWIIAPVPTIEARSVGGVNRPIVDSLVLAVAMLVTVVVAWWGPASYGTRVGAATLLPRL